jgi:uncharacterized protein (TIGR02391 family)
MGRMKAALRITADKKAKINELVEIVHSFLPLSSRSKSAITFTTIFKESKVDRYLNMDNKKQALQNGFENVFRYHPKLPKKLFRKIVPAAIEYRRFKRNPLTKEELNTLIKRLDAMGVNMKAELSKIEIDESLPEIQVPPSELLIRLLNHPLEGELATEPVSLFKNGHFNEAVRKASERFEARIQNLTGFKEIGKSLMGKAFTIQAPAILLNTLSTENEKSFQEGYMHLAMGTMASIRNIFSHGDENTRSPEECFEMLMYLNWLFRHLPK